MQNLQIERSRRQELEREKLRNYELMQYEKNRVLTTAMHSELREKEVSFLLIMIVTETGRY